MLHGTWFFFLDELQKRPAHHFSWWERRLLRRLTRKMTKGTLCSLSGWAMRKLGQLAHREDIHSLDMYANLASAEHYKAVSFANSLLMQAWHR